MTDAVTDTHSLIWYLEDSPRVTLPSSSGDHRIDLSEVEAIW